MVWGLSGSTGGSAVMQSRRRARLLKHWMPRPRDLQPLGEGEWAGSVRLYLGL